MGIAALNLALMQLGAAGQAGGVGGAGGADGQSVPTKSLRFDDGSSPELSRTYTSSATWTFACWVKRGELGATNYLLGSVIGFNASDQLFAPGITNTTELFRDPTAWLHICCSDSGLYVNGVQLSGTVSTSALTDAKIGDDFDGYLHDIYFVEGSAVTPVGNFIEDSTSGVYKPKVYDLSGDGSNSFRLANEAGHDSELLVTSDHADGSTLIYDSSGAGHAITIAGNTNHQDTVGTPFGSGSAIKFDGSGDYLTVADSTSWTFGSGDFTIETWINFSAWESSNFNTIAWFGPVQIDHKRDGGTNQLRMFCYDSGGSTSNIQTWDASLDTWYHVAAVRDSGTLRLFVDGTSLGTESISSTLTDATGASAIMARAANSVGGVGTPDRLSTGYIYDFRVSKSAKYSANFTKPAEPFESTYIAVGADSSGNKNHFSATNLNLGHDVVPDIPTNNFCTLNELTNSASALSEGSLKWPADTYARNCLGTFGVSSGKWYFECVHTGGGSANGMNVGIATSGLGNYSSDPNVTMPSGHYWHAIDSRSVFCNNTTTTSNSTAFGLGNVIGVAIDLDAATNTVTYTLDGTTVGSAQDLESGQTWFPHVKSSSFTSTPRILNFGQDGTFVGTETAGGNSDGNGKGDFYSSVPSGHLALCSANLSATIADPSAYFQTKTFDDGDGAKTFDGNSNLQPDLVWLKSRGSSSSHKLVDSVRGVEIALSSDGTDAEATESDGLTTFGTDGFTVGDNSDYDDETGDGMVAWGWKKGATQGFDIVTYDGDDNDANMGGPQSISHGLGVKPDMILIKARLGEAYNDNSDNGDWIVWHSSLSSDNHYLHLNTTDSVDTTDDSGSFFEKFLDNITSSSFDVGNGGGETSGNYHLMNWDGTAGAWGGSLEKYVAYCWSGVAGYSKAFKFTGTNPYVHLGFRPAWIILKRTDSTGNWLIIDDKREGYNVDNDPLYADTTAIEGTTDLIDITSNGFRVRSTDSNISGTVIGFAMASAPAKYSLAR